MWQILFSFAGGYLAKNETIPNRIYLSSRGGLEEEQWSDNRTLSIPVD